MIEIECTSANPNNKRVIKVENFNSYNFDRNILTPSSAFRFTAPGVNKSDRMAIRSGDQIRLLITNRLGHKAVVGVGFIDETDTHITPQSVEYVLTGRDTIGQLVDNDTVDANNKIILFERANIDVLVTSLLANTRMIQTYRSKQIDKGVSFAVSTNLGETKINTLQRYLEFVNGLIWASNTGEAIVDKPNFSQNPAGVFTLKYSDPSSNNVLECRVRRNINQAVRQIVMQLDGTEAASNTYETLNNMDKSLRPYRKSNVGRSISRLFSYAHGAEIINQQQGVGHGDLGRHTLSREYAAREIARENIKILDIEIVVDGHFNAAGYIYNIDQIYQVTIEDEDVSEPMYVYSVSYEMTLGHGMLTRMRLCRKFTICAYTQMLDSVVSS